ncbi:MAG: CHAT domain-containing tetratricopeptide repeat protein [Cyanobacteria bacterium P01_A01_bin.123]
MMKRSRWRSRLLAITLAVATWLWVTVPAQSTLPYYQEHNFPSQAAFSHEARQTKQQDSDGTVLLEVEGTLEAGDQRLEDGSLYDIYPFEGEAGQSITIRMMSDEFDTFIGVVNTAGELIYESAANSNLSVFLPETATYQIIATIFDDSGQGQYRLTVSAASASETQLAEANHLRQLGIQQYLTSQFQSALQSWQQAIAIYRSSDIREAFPEASRQGEAAALGNLGLVYHASGQYQQAIDFYQQSLAIAREIRDRQGEANALGNLGSTYSSLGQYQRATDLHQQSLAIKREIDDRRGEATSLGNLGNIYRSLGQYEQAIAAYQQALDIADEIRDIDIQAAALSNLGLVYLALGEYQQALDLHQQALAIARNTGNRQSEAYSLGHLGIAYYALGQDQRAIDFYQQQLTIVRDIGDRQGEASVLSYLGGVYNTLGQSQQAIEFHQQSLDIIRDIGDRQGEAMALNSLGISLISTNQPAEAEIVLAQSIEIFESLRTDLPDAQLIALADTQAGAYTLLELALTIQDKTAEALETTERARARAFVLQLASRLSNREESTPLAEPEATPPPKIADIQQIARDQNATLVTYSLIYDRALYIWVVQPSGEIEFRSVELGGSGSLPNPIAAIDGPVYRGNSDPSELDTLVSETRAGIGVVASIPSERLKDLHQVLIEPIADLLPSDPDANVVFIPQGSLFLVPFPALQDADDTYLIEKHTVLTAPSIQVFGLAAREEAQGRRSEFSDALVVGNPVMPQAWALGDNGLEELQLAPLPGAEAEALAIGDFLNVSPLIGAQATEAQIKQQFPSAQLIHLATHGLLEYGDPQSSGVLDVPGALALTPGDGEDGLLTAAEILEIDLQAELAVLSACDTGRGRITGDGVVGLSRSLITAGVPSVIVSLWAVPDAPTAALMTEFYRQLQQGQSKAQALRQAMLATLNDSPEPVNWAAFTLMGAIE